MSDMPIAAAPIRHRPAWIGERPTLEQRYSRRKVNHHPQLRTGAPLASRALCGVFAWGRDAYPGRLGGGWLLFGQRAALATVRDWIRGRRGMPAWAWRVLLDRLVSDRDRLVLLVPEVEAALAAAEAREALNRRGGKRVGFAEIGPDGFDKRGKGGRKEGRKRG